MDQRSRAVVASAGIVAVFLLVQLGALALVEPFRAAGYQPVENPDDPTNSLVYVAAILVITALLLAAIRLELDQVIRAFIVFAGAYIALYVFQIWLPAVESLPAPGGFHAVAWLCAAALGVALWVYPEWYVIDAAGVVMGVGAAGLFGITFGILPAILLLVVLAVYDAISVYGTEHMLTLASGVLEMRVPIVLVVPLSLSYSFLDADLPDPAAEHDEDDGSVAGRDVTPAEVDETTGVADGNGADDGAAEPGGDGAAPGDADATDAESATDATAVEASPLDREALFIGLGDAIVPAILVASAGFFLRSVPTVAVGNLAVSLPALGAMAGTLVGLVVLLRLVLAGRAHAGLPLLNGGAIAGYLVGALASGLTLAQALGLAPFL